MTKPKMNGCKVITAVLAKALSSVMFCSAK